MGVYFVRRTWDVGRANYTIRVKLTKHVERGTLDVRITRYALHVPSPYSSPQRGEEKRGV